MGKYLDAINNWTIDGFNSSFELQNDTISAAIDTTREKTNDIFGGSVLGFLYVMILIHISTPSNQFNLTFIQSLITTSTIILSMAIMFIFLGIMASIKVFVWFVLIYFLIQVWGIMRTTT